MTPAEKQAWVTVLLSQSLGDYRPTRFINAGQFGLVFEAEDVRDGKVIALKVLIPGSPADAVGDFDLEGRLLGELRRSVGVVDLVVSDKCSVDVRAGGVTVPLPIRYHVMELASGCLEEIVADEASRDRLEWGERLRLWRGVILGVHQMHLKGLVHRDLKSSNCLLMVYRRRPATCKVSDLGRARDLALPPRVPLQEYLAGRGDLRFAPPEFLWLQGDDSPEAHKAADLYGLGSLLFELATGVGITHLALGYGPRLLDDALKHFRSGQVSDLSALRGRYQGSFDLFSDQSPPAIRQQATKLLRQLCDPDPDRRMPQTAPGRRAPRSQGLEWLLRSADILIRRLEVAPASRHRAKAVS